MKIWKDNITGKEHGFFSHSQICIQICKYTENAKCLNTICEPESLYCFVNLDWENTLMHAEGSDRGGGGL